MKKPCWHVRLGEDEWSRFTYARLPADGMRLIGSIRKGLQIGALALTDKGQYLAVNGDWITPLNFTQVQKAVNAAKALHIKYFHRNARYVSQPVVTVKRHRALQYG